MTSNFLTVVGADFFNVFLTSLGIGLLIGLERERNLTSRAGLRTCALFSLLGTILALLADKTGSAWLLAAGLLMVGTTMVLAYASNPNPDDAGTTTVAAVLLCYCFGAMVWYGYSTLAVMLAILSTILLYFKAELHGWTRRLSERDVLSILQFAVLALIILPILPNRDFGPYNALNPHQIWWMVVLISGVSLAGYAALRIAGPRQGAPLMGVLGGLVSSTATTLVFSRHTRDQPSVAALALVVILTANLIVQVRLVILAGLLAPSILHQLAPVMLAGLIVGLGMVIWAWRSLQSEQRSPELVLTNPTEIRTALTFATIYTVVLFLSAWLADYVGNSGLYILALISGLTDVDAIALSSMRLFNLGKMGAEQVVTATVLALLANLIFKLGVVIVVTNRNLAWRVALGFTGVAVGLAVGWLIWTLPAMA